MEYDVIKIGGSVLTRKHGYLEADEKEIASISKTLGDYWKKKKRKFIFIHGAGSFGHAPVIAYNLKKGFSGEEGKIGFSDVHTSCTYLSTLICSHLVRNGVPAVLIPPLAIAKTKSKRVTRINEKPVVEALKKGFVPVLFGDMVFDDELGGVPLSGDLLLKRFGKNAGRIYSGSNVDGVIIDGKLVRKITKENYEEIKPKIRGASTPDVTGGMAEKVRLLMSIGKKAYLFNASKRKVMEPLFLENRFYGTLIDGR